MGDQNGLPALTFHNSISECSASSTLFKTSRSNPLSRHRKGWQRCASRRRTRLPRCPSPRPRCRLGVRRVGWGGQVRHPLPPPPGGGPVEAEGGAALQALLVGVEVDVL